MTIALIGGTSLLESRRFHDAAPRRMQTPYGAVTLLELDNGVLFLQRHGLGTYLPPHLINHQANLSALHQARVKQILAISSVGSLRPEIPPGSFVLPDDFLAPHIHHSMFEDARGHQTPGFDAAWRQQLLEIWRKTDLPQPLDGGVYWQTVGPRFETPAEIRMYQPHAHIVGMTVASECILAADLKIPYAALCIVDNYANGLTDTPLTFATFKEQVKANHEKLLIVLETLLLKLML
ncbi:MAG: MTAP family purine nucleoside phosphorylase [Magnetococcales bacterium]|nr:MTAP family purine nucleoside phosphorylase [Magnetococcales bacterium]NGZ07293.1 MTAP family purine nucleoside phosphorylase [Magnetococcales bacterium]